MRKIGTLETKEQAETLGHYLHTQKMKNTLREGENNSWTIWIHNEDEISEAKSQLEKFKNDPENKCYQKSIQKSKILKKQEVVEKKEFQRNFINVRQNWHMRENPIAFGHFTFFLVALNVVIFMTIWSKSQDGSYNQDALKNLLITENRQGGLKEFWAGEFWRLLTPAFIHWSFIHILFNMLWLKDLGSLIEHRKGAWFLALQLVVMGVAANLAQLYSSGPLFGGMSGVIYGLLGYIWMRGKFDPSSGFFLPKSTVTFMIVWFFLCFALDNIGNAAHGTGLAIGITWGIIDSGIVGHKIRQHRFFQK